MFTCLKALLTFLCTCRLNEEQTAEVTAAFTLFAKPGTNGKLLLDVSDLHQVCQKNSLYFGCPYPKLPVRSIVRAHS